MGPAPGAWCAHYTPIAACSLRGGPEFLGQGGGDRVRGGQGAPGAWLVGLPLIALALVAGSAALRRTRRVGAC